MAGQSIVISVLAETSKFTRGMQSVSSGLGSMMKGIGVGIAVGVAAAGAAVVTLTKTVVGATGALEQSAGGVEAVFGDVADEVKRASAEAFRFGVSATDFMASQAKLGSLMQANGLSAEKAWESSNALMVRGADMATVMGISTADANRAIEGMAKGNFTMMDNLGVAMDDTTLKAYALEKGLDYSSRAEKNAVAMEYFMDKTSQYAGNAAREASKTIEGSFGMLKASWADLLAGMGTSGSDMNQLIANVGESIQNVATNLTPVVEQLAQNIPKVLTGLIPIVLGLAPELLAAGTEMINSLLAGIVAAMPTLIAQVAPILLGFVQGILEQLPMILDAGIQLLVTLAEGLTQAIPTLIPVAVDTILKLVDVLLDNLDLIVEAAIVLIVTLAVALIDALPRLAAKVPEIVVAIARVLLDNVDTIVVAGFKLLIALIRNLPSIIGTIVTAAPRIVAGLVVAFASKVGEMARVGGDLLRGLWNGISDLSGWLKSKIEGIAGNVTTWVKNMFGIRSPSRVFASIGEMNVQGLAQGLGRTGSVERAVSALGNLVTGGFESELAFDTARRGGTVNVYSFDGMEFTTSSDAEASILEEFVALARRKARAA